MDSPATDSESEITDSFFLSPTNTYDGLLDSKCSVDLTDILQECSSILNFTEEPDEYAVTGKTPQSVILSGSNVDIKYPEDTSQIRYNNTFSSIGEAVNRFNLSGTSFCMEKMERSICLGRLDHSSLLGNSFMLSESGKVLNWVTENKGEDSKKIENESCPDWNSIIDTSFFERTTEDLVSIERHSNVPVIMISKSTGDVCVNGKKLIYNEIKKADSKNFLTIQNDNSNFFHRRRGKVYFQSPEKLRKQNETKGSDMKSTDGSSPSPENHRVGNENFEQSFSELSSFKIENITVPQWPSFINESDPEALEGNFSKFETSTPKDIITLSPNITESPVNTGNKRTEKTTSTVKFNFGVNAIKFFSRKKITKYFNTPKKC